VNITDDDLLRRAITNCRSKNHGRKHYRWVAVMDVFVLGSSYSRELCLRFGFDPDEMVNR
jgi:hypothetical protein